MRPHPLTKHLSLLRTALLFPVCSILLLLSGKLLKSHVDTAGSTASAIWRRGFTALFWPGKDDTHQVWRRGDIPRVETLSSRRQTCLWLAREEVCLYAVQFSRRFDEVSNIISSYTALPFTPTASFQRYSFEKKERPRFIVQGYSGLLRREYWWHLKPRFFQWFSRWQTVLVNGWPMTVFCNHFRKF